jgi:hypothetical protein
VRLAAITADEPFLFYNGVGEINFTGTTAWSLKGFAKAMQKVGVKSLEFHSKRGDFEKWVGKSLHDKKLVEHLKKIRLAKLKGEPLRKSLIKVLGERFKELSEQTQTATRYF